MKTLFIYLFIVAVIAQTCTSPKVSINMRRTYKNDANQETVQIWQGNYKTGTLIAEYNGLGMGNTVQTYSLCLAPSQHTLVALDSAKNGWTDGSRFDLVTRAGVTILYGTLDRFQKKEFVFYPAFSVKSTDSWKYINTAQTGNQWTQASFSDAAWIAYSPSKFPVVSTVTRYFRTQVDLPSNKNSFAIGEIGAFTKDGVVIYVNGQEIYRRNVPTGAAATTPATAIDTEASYKRITFPTSATYLTGSKVTLAIEIHGSSTPSSVAEDFIGYLIFIYGPCAARLTDYTATAERNPEDPNEPIDKIFDGDIQTKWYANPLPIWGQVQFNNGRREWINRYSVSVGNYDVNRRPISWKLLASNDGNTFVVLDSKNFVTWDGFRTTRNFELNTNKEAYNIYRIQILATKGTDMELTELELSACTNAILTPTLSYGTTSLNLVTNLDEKVLYPTQNGFENFVITPAVPADSGLTFDAVSGSFKIYPTAVIALTSFSISARHYSNQQTSTVTISISASECVAPKVRFDIKQANGNDNTNGEPETVTIISPNNVELASSSLSASDIGTNERTIKLCQDPGVYTVKMTAASLVGWAYSSYVQINLFTYDGSSFTASRGKLIDQISDSFKVNIKYELPTSTKVLLNAASIPAGWKETSYAGESTWVTYTKTPAMQSTTKYALFRSTFTISSLTGIQGFEFLYRANDAVAVYVDGKLITKYWITPKGDDYTATPSSEGHQDKVEWRGVTGVLSDLAVGTHVIAVLLVDGKNPYVARNVDYDCMIRLLSDSNTVSRTFDANSSESNKVWDGANVLFDGSYKTRFAAYIDSTHPAPQWASGNFKQWRFEAINKYCIVANYDAPKHDPKKFSLLGSMGGWDAADYTLLDTQENVSFDRRSQRLCFYIPSNTKAYNIYRIRFEEVNVPFPENDKVILAELELFLIDYNKITISPLSYQSSSITGYSNSQITTNFPTSEYYRNYQITPALPTGLKLSSSGTIYGTPIAPSSSTYQISAVSIMGTAASTSVSINIQTCTAPNVYFRLSFTNMESDSEQNGFSLKDAAGTVIDSVETFPNYIGSYARGYCKPAGVYILVLTDTYRDGWGNGKVTAYAEDNTEITSSGLLKGESPKTIYINVGFIVKFGQTQWKYTSTAPSADWNSITFVDSTWQTAVGGSFVGVSGKTQFYRTSFTINDLSLFSLYEITFNIKAGIIAYINGKEVYRYNLGSGVITPSTSATAEFAEPTKITVSESSAFGKLVTGNNVLAVEIHNFGPTAETTFDAQLMLYLSGSNRIFDGTVYASVKGLKDNTYDESEQKAFDGNLNTKYYGPGCNKQYYLEYTYNYNRKEYATAIALSRGTNNGRLPSSFALSASNDGVNYKNLVSYYNLTFGNHGSAEGTRTFNFFNKDSYNKYRVSLDSRVCVEGLEIGEIALMSNKIESYCKAEGQYIDTISGQSSYRPCENYYYGAYSKLCTGGVWGPEVRSCEVVAPRAFNYTAKSYVFKTKRDNVTPAPYYEAAEPVFNITPDLPAGLTINRSTGIISGKPQNDFAETDFVIILYNAKGKKSFTITLSSIPAGGLEGWSIAVIVIACIVIVIFIGFIVFVVMNRRKGKKGSHKVMKAGTKATTPAKPADKKVRI
ncbi:hypothetical protein WA158_000015 [Blastocystis sp. Blastoise]